MLKQLLDAAGYEIEAYSGRGMYGAECVSINLDSEAELVELGAKLMDRAIDNGCPAELLNVLRATRTDSMGSGLVAYWPSQKWESK